MTQLIEEIDRLIRESSAEKRATLRKRIHTLVPHPLESDWEIDADTILTAIRRSNDITKRGVRGIIAEAVFEDQVLPTVRALGWEPQEIVGDLSYDVRLENGDRSVRIQIKLQRLAVGTPLHYYPKHYKEGSLFVVEVQRTRTGKVKVKKETRMVGAEEIQVLAAEPTENTRPYRFSDFDILAVNMHPSSRDWTDFRFTLSSWLLPRQQTPALIEVMQPVAATPNEVWTNSLRECLDWFVSGEKGTVLKELVHKKVTIRPKKAKPAKNVKKIAKVSSKSKKKQK